MTQRHPPLDDALESSPADEEELLRAAALARALDDGRAEPGLLDDDLATAALLRAGAGSVRLGERRRLALRDELMASLPPPRARRPRWWLASLPLAAAAALLLLLVGPRRELAPAARSGAEQAAPPEAASAEALAKRAEAPSAASATAASSAAAASGARPGAAPLAGGARSALTRDLAEQVSEQRRRLLARASDGALSRAHAELDAARSRPALERASRTLRELSEGLDDRADTDGRLLRQDLYCRLAETALRLGEPDSALEWTRRGLDLDGPPTPLLAQLQALEGDAWAALGDPERAASAYLRALGVHETLLGEDLDAE